MKWSGLRSWCEHHPDQAIFLALALLALALMSPYLFQAEVVVWPRSGLGTDLLNYRWTHVYYLRRSLQETGQIPLWRASSLGGEPMIGNPAVMLVYPVQLLLALLPVPLLPSFAWMTVLHLWLAGMGAYLLARQVVGLRRAAALVTALATTLMPRLSSNAVGDIGLDYAMCWLPLTLACARLALDRRSLEWAVPAAGGLAAQFLIHVHIFFYTAWAIGLYFLYQTVQSLPALRREGHGRAWLERAGLLALIALLCTGLVAFELLPFATYLRWLSRATMDLERANAYALPPLMLLTALMPSSLKFPEWELYAGLLPVVLLPLAFLSPRRREVVFWIGLGLFGALFSLGTATPLFGFLFRYVPGFNWLRVPARMWLLTNLSLAVLAGIAVEALASQRAWKQWGRSWQNWFLLGGSTAALATLFGRWLLRRPGEADWLLGLLGVAGLGLGLIGVWLWMQRRMVFATSSLLLVGGLLLDLFPVDAAYMTRMPAAEVFAMPAVGASLLEPQARAGGLFRVYAVRSTVPYHIAAHQGLEFADGLNSFQFAGYVSLINLASGCELSGFAASVPRCSTNELSPTAYRDAVPDPALLGLLNVRYVISPLPLSGPAWALRDNAGDGYLYENTLVLPRAFGVGCTEIVPDGPALWQRLREIDVGQVALVESGPAGARPACVPFHAPARRIDFQPNQIRVEIDMPGDGLLVLGEVWTPGWRVTVDGVPAEVVRVDGALRGVYLTAGQHQIRFWFLPPALLLGLAVSGVTLVVCAVLLVRFWRRRQDAE